MNSASLLRIVASVLGLWSLAAPWAAAFPSRPDHYKATLFGVRHVLDMSATSAQSECYWGDDEEPCQAAAGAETKFKLLTAARWFMLAALAILFAASGRFRHSATRVSWLYVGAALAGASAIVLFEGNVAAALAVFDGARVEPRGTGAIAAIASTMLAAAAGGLASWRSRSA